MRPTTKTADPELLRAYREADRALRVQYSKVGSLLSLLLVPAGSSLEYFVYPGLFWHIFKVRLACDALTLPIFLLHFTDFGKKHIRSLAMSWVLLVQLAICYMIYASEGPASPYYAGLNLVLVCVTVVLPWTLWETALICAATLSAYLAACFAHPGALGQSGIFYNNLFFIVTTSIVCVTASHLTARRRFEDFRLRYELDLRNEELAESYEKLSELDRMKSEFFANISHELRTPLTLILTPVQKLLERPTGLSEAIGQVLETVRGNALRLLRLINDLLEVIRLEEGAVQVDREPLDVSVLVPGLVDSVRHLAESKQLTLTVEGHEGPLVVMGDSWHLEKVFINLLTNAIKFTPEGGRIVARWKRRGDRAVVEVEDTGPGIPEGDLPHIFDRFRQVDGSSTRKHQGVGIGLALARQIVEKHEGELTVNSTVGEGSVFRVELPVTDERPPARGPAAAGPSESDRLAEVYREADLSMPERAEEAVDAEPVGSGETTVLVVDDEPDMRRFLVELLAPDHRVLQAADGETALRKAEEDRPDLIVLDLMLPGIDGLEVCERIKGPERMRGTKVLLLTARSDEKSKIAALKRGADDFLVKPFSSVEVQTRISNLLRTRRLEADLRQQNRELEETLQKLKETEAQLIQSEKMSALGNLSAGILHEVNNPLKYALTAVQLARQSADETDEMLIESLADIEEGMVRIRDIVSDLRTFAYPAESEETQPFDLSEAVDAALRLTARELDGHQVETDLPEPCLISGAESQITHVLINLLTNSAHALASADGTRQPRIRVRAETDEERVRVTVWDNGCGIAPEDLPDVLDPFFTTREVGEGMGLGLSICHTIVRNHGGQLRVESEPGEWTEVSFDLPQPTEGKRDEQWV
ncbi:MAG: ATP-binding protein [Planctomycetota bacterium]